MPMEKHLITIFILDIVFPEDEDTPMAPVPATEINTGTDDELSEETLSDIDSEEDIGQKKKGQLHKK